MRHDRGYATLKDNFGNGYKQVHFEFGTVPIGAVENYEAIHPATKEPPTRPDGSLRGSDVLVFECAIPTATHLELDLPAANFGADGIVRFRFPLKSIKGTKAYDEEIASKKREEEYRVILAAAQRNMRSQQFAKAKAAYEALLARFPGDTTAIAGCKEADENLAQEERTRRERLAQEELARRDSQFEALMKTGRESMTNKKFRDAIASFGKALELTGGKNAAAIAALDEGAEQETLMIWSRKKNARNKRKLGSPRRRLRIAEEKRRAEARIAADKKRKADLEAAACPTTRPKARSLNS